jgi:membrane fusion protein (multidrug efflux system)
VALDPQQLAKNPLRIGLSMEATVDIHERDGPVLATVPRTQPAYSTPVFDADARDADALIGKIVRANVSGATVPTARLAARPQTGIRPASFNAGG